MTYLDTRDLYKRQCELQAELDDLNESVGGAEEAEELEQAETALTEWEDEYQEELDELNNLENEIGSQWMHGEILIPEEDWVDYVQDLAEDIGAIDRNATWPLNHIDWEAAAEGLLIDYAECEYQGYTYYFRMS